MNARRRRWPWVMLAFVVVASPLARTLHAVLPTGRLRLEVAGMKHSDLIQHPEDSVWWPIEAFVPKR